MKTPIFLFALLVSIINNLQAQERVNRKSEVTFDTYGKTLTKATGWKYNFALGRWYSNNNRLCDNDCSVFEASHNENFKWIQFRTLTHRNKKYYAMVFEYTAGYYRYPAISQDWISFNITNCLVYDSTEYYNAIKKLDSLPEKGVQMFAMVYAEIKSNFDLLGAEDAYTEDVLFNKLTKQFQSPPEHSYACLTFKPTMSEGKKVVRFILPTHTVNCYENVTKNLSNQYYEIDIESFKKILLK